MRLAGEGVGRRLRLGRGAECHVPLLAALFDSESHLRAGAAAIEGRDKMLPRHGTGIDVVDGNDDVAPGKGKGMRLSDAAGLDGAHL